MPDEFICPECKESHDGPGVCGECGLSYVDLTGFDLDDGAKSIKTIDDADPLAMEDQSSEAEELPEAA